MSLVAIGEGSLLNGQFERALWALDAELYLHPGGSLWQRGLCCFYTGHYKEGAEQFQSDLSENGDDVEEVIWNFLCQCGLHDFRRAFADGFLPLRGDCAPVLPMQQVLDLYKGRGSVEDVLAAATSTDGSLVKSYDTNALAYGHFYVGTYHEVRGELSQARHHLQCAAGFRNPDYMGELMGMHYRRFCHNHRPL